MNLAFCLQTTLIFLFSVHMFLGSSPSWVLPVSCLGNTVQLPFFLYTLKSYDNSLISYSNQFLSFDAHLNSEVTVQAICTPTHNLDHGCISPCVWSNVFWSWITQSFVKYSHLMTALETTLLDQNLFTFLLSEVKQKGHKWLNSLWFIKILQIKLDKTPFLRFTFFF